MQWIRYSTWRDLEQKGAMFLSYAVPCPNLLPTDPQAPKVVKQSTQTINIQLLHHSFLFIYIYFFLPLILKGKDSISAQVNKDRS